MRVLHILNYVLNVGNGVVNAAIDLACTQAKFGLNVAIASAGGEYESLIESYGIQHFSLKQSGLIQFLKAPLRFCQIVDHFQPDIIHVHMAPGVILSRLFQWRYHYDLVSTVHSEFQRNAVLMGLANRVIVVSQSVGVSMIKRGLSKEKIKVVLNGTLGSPRLKSKADYQAAPLHHPAITTVAGMYVRKGIAELIDAFITIAPQFENAHLYLVGNGPDIEQFKAQAASSPAAQRIHFEGFRPNPQSYLLATDIFVLVSHKDPAPLVIPEAREMGCAIIGSQVDGIPELLDQGEAGVLVPPQNSQALARVLADLLSQPQKLQDLRSRSQRNLEPFKLERVCQETVEIYKELLEGNPLSQGKALL